MFAADRGYERVQRSTRQVGEVLKRVLCQRSLRIGGVVAVRIMMQEGIARVRRACRLLHTGTASARLSGRGKLMRRGRGERGRRGRGGVCHVQKATSNNSVRRGRVRRQGGGEIWRKIARGKVEAAIVADGVERRHGSGPKTSRRERHATKTPSYTTTNRVHRGRPRAAVLGRR